jgi:2-methylisocitrate lyase-like PEP mutase family enzyme
MALPAAQRERARRLGELHQGPAVLVLLNAWDVAGARVLEALPGCEALGTTSAGISAALGYLDGEHIDRDEMLGVVARIARAVDVPVTADLEMGFGETPAEVAETAVAAIDAGAVGMNIEDGVQRSARLYPLEDQAAKLAAVREAADALDIAFVVNARIDVYWRSVGEPEERFAETVRRARAYREAGADCVFVPGLTDERAITELLRESPGPLNLLAGGSTPPVPALQRLGVARVSVGSGISRAALAFVRRAGRELLEDGTYGAISEDTIPFAEVARLLAPDDR